MGGFGFLLKGVFLGRQKGKQLPRRPKKGRVVDRGGEKKGKNRRGFRSTSSKNTLNNNNGEDP